MTEQKQNPTGNLTVLTSDEEGISPLYSNVGKGIPNDSNVMNWFNLSVTASLLVHDTFSISSSQDPLTLRDLTSVNADGQGS